MPSKVLALLEQVRLKWSPIALPPPDAYRNASVVITGGTSGLGLATAVHAVNLGASSVTITSRGSDKGTVALAAISTQTNGRSEGVVRVAALDMDSFASVVAFVDEVKGIRKEEGGVDYVFLNAGVIGTEFKMLESGWEQNLQVNVLSTALIALLLLPTLKSQHPYRTSRGKPPSHIVTVGSSRHLDPDIDAWLSYPEGVLSHYNSPAHFPSPTSGQLYAATKLLQQYAVNELAALALAPIPSSSPSPHTDIIAHDDAPLVLAVPEKKKPHVLLTTCCPGIVNTSLARGFRAQGNFATAAGIGAFQALLGKSPANGARTLVRAGWAGEGDHGRFIRFYGGSGAEYEARAGTCVTGEKGGAMQRRAWGEITAALVRDVPEARGALAELGWKRG
ncbi:NAD(P)-binding protein [Xylariaceae sp. FL0016]|nr:NAD(P)-binding protein [Xylariaceae sp. FL0016]